MAPRKIFPQHNMDDLIIVSETGKRIPLSEYDCQIIEVKNHSQTKYPEVEIVSSKTYTRNLERFDSPIEIIPHRMNSSRIRRRNNQDIEILDSPHRTNTRIQQRSAARNTNRILDVISPRRSRPDSFVNTLPTSAITREIISQVTENPKPRPKMLPQFIPKLDPGPKVEPAMLKCTICLELASPSTQLVSTNCGHIFCEECLISALKVAKKCPNCRKKLAAKNSWHKLFLG